MRNATIALAIAAALSPAGARAELSVSEAFERLEGGGEVARIFETFIRGNGNGISWANSFLEQTGGDPIYCPPRDLTLDGEKEIALLREALSRDASIGELPLGLAVMLALRGAYPC